MLARALVVLLLVLNLGVAAWWMLRAPPATAPAFVPPAGVATLQRIDESRPAPAPSPATAPAARPPAAAAPAEAIAPIPESTTTAPPANAAAPATVAAPARCYTVGPFADSAAASNAREVLMAVASRVTPREQRSGSAARGWRVYLPPMATLAEAQAAAQRISAAGLDDYFIVRQGNEANSIALGRYRNEDAARRRADTLAAAGFAVRAEPLGEGGPATVWLDLVAKPGFDPARAEAAVQVPARELDCARMR